jgi:transcriptional regulator with XRE-family HTH domain
MSEKDLRHVFAINVRRIRHEKNLSQEELAALSGLHRTYISDIEREERNISLANIDRIASALDVDPSKLLEKPE